MQIKYLTPFFWIALALVFVELPLEYRAVSRGWYAPLVGDLEQNDAPVAETPSSEDPRAYGPTPEYPFWSPVYSAAPAPAVRRLWLASASHAAEIRMPARAAFPNLFEGLCRARGQGLEVMNGSHPDFQIADNVAQLEAYGPRYRPSQVLLYQMSNDLTDVVRRHFAGAPSAADAAVSLPPPVEPTLATQLVEEATLYTVVKRNLTSRMVYGRVLADELPEAAQAAYEQRVRTWIRTVRQMGGTPVLATFASSHAAGELEALPSATILGLFSFNIYLSPEGWINAVAALNQRIKDVGKAESIRVVDLAAAMKGRSDLFKDFVHFTPEGHQVLARALADELCPVSLARGPRG